jgi:rhodanese-related sulfurtransferase/TusA-related sulfurtransferase
MTSCNIHATLDCSGYDCPMVLVQLKECLDRLEEGEIVEVITEDTPNFQLVLKGWSAETNDHYYNSFRENMKTHHYIQKARESVRKDPVPFPGIITNDELKSMLLTKKPIHIMDVREDIEFMLGHVPQAINVPLSNFTENLAKFKREETYYVICRTGNRSDYACKYLRKLGFKNVYNVLPGMYQWDGPVVEEDVI